MTESDVKALMSNKDFSLTERFIMATIILDVLRDGGAKISELSLKGQIYAHYRQGAFGPAMRTKSPSVTDPVERAKWNGWDSIKKLPQKEAQEAYINLGLKLLPIHLAKIAKLKPEIEKELKTASAKHQAALTKHQLALAKESKSSPASIISTKKLPTQDAFDKASKKYENLMVFENLTLIPGLYELSIAKIKVLIAEANMPEKMNVEIAQLQIKSLKELQDQHELIVKEYKKTAADTAGFAAAAKTVEIEQESQLQVEKLNELRNQFKEFKEGEIPKGSNESAPVTFAAYMDKLGKTQASNADTTNQVKQITGLGFAYAQVGAGAGIISSESNESDIKAFKLAA